MIATVAANYGAILNAKPIVKRILGGMTAISGMVMLFSTNDQGEYFIHYHCAETDGRQHVKHFAAIPEDVSFLGTTPVRGYEYTPEGGGNRFADIYYRAKAS
ncbi:MULTISPECIES: hypothetical protein [unclassified Streptomyces]|uniref:hypothetical protein n=1 Tax=unclassified Streptomyces TaxID=2593676 RepID=UPI0022AEE20C|nr:MULTISPECIES: hypothetical protein [unclassified Streptomyces]MCZ4097323.1 hypothetical protein [Streptomyces sp. H39-C1]MCZ4120627.1 hypothetical protein [Streptomyces sp. H39-S7]